MTTAIADHIQEVLHKWEQIDDEIWAKIICMERNRRVAKAYARAPELEINGSADGFDGFKIGLNAFDNPMRDEKTHETKKRIGMGARITMDASGNIVIKRISKSSIFVNSVQHGESSAISKEVIDSRGHLDFDKPVKLFDMDKFRANVIREMKRAYPDRRTLEAQCVSCISFVRDSSDVLQVPVWVMVINIVALDMLKSKLPPQYAVPAATKRQSAPNLMSIFDSRDGEGRSKDDLEDPYTALPGGASSSGSSGGHASHAKRDHREPRPPKLPPRDKRPRVPRVSTPQPDYEDTSYSGVPVHMQMQRSGGGNERQPARKISSSSGIYDDPYYCGLKARVSNFGQRDPLNMSRRDRERLQKDAIYAYASSNHSFSYLNSLYGAAKNRENSLYQSADHDYSKIYGVLPLRQNSTAQSSSSGGSSAGATPTYTHGPKEVYVGEWE
ncbi:uncharacterized protein LOC111243619 isoform X3 [Varroa destructor]|uniref:MH2 domain-containing protein n=1 Tax=Varroa destructor TaxID=109461 RepID=A0A7M7J112_VARDE|nr:uncharacterized protein LOC111243619 isoform X3 [Varroa destructor]